ncbi:hypothetical protein EC845_3371 [Comamonas sp. BIGb0124]|uniref:hypothetical protein n=1 Tax=Comamonas sp. BIGb0124 TaxID=2485130 RepID=UPI000F4A82C2|nr:hypothetical protein [Comamonas sp. BIGb0124]ROR18399.1 hypothetical protein EC845_3371 [Comamonas sp. BIGb0124]
MIGPTRPEPVASDAQKFSDIDLCALIEADLNRLTGTLFVVGHFFESAEENELLLAQEHLMTMIQHAAKVADRVVTYSQCGVNPMSGGAQEEIMQAAGILASLNVMTATADLDSHASDAVMSSTIDAARDCIDRAIALMSPDSIEGVRYKVMFDLEARHPVGSGSPATV